MELEKFLIQEFSIFFFIFQIFLGQYINLYGQILMLICVKLLSNVKFDLYFFLLEVLKLDYLEVIGCRVF